MGLLLVLKTVLKKNPKTPEEAPKLYASAVHGVKVDIQELALAVSERCSLRRSDLHGALIALMEIIPNDLLKGNIVSLGELESFYTNVKSEGALSITCAVNFIELRAVGRGQKGQSQGEDDCLLTLGAGFGNQIKNC